MLRTCWVGTGHHQPVPRAAQNRQGRLCAPARPKALLAQARCGDRNQRGRASRGTLIRSVRLACVYRWLRPGTTGPGGPGGQGCGARDRSFPARPTSCWPSSMRSGAASRPRWLRPSASRACCLCSAQRQSAGGGQRARQPTADPVRGCVNVIDQFDGYKPLDCRSMATRCARGHHQHHAGYRGSGAARPPSGSGLSWH